MTHNDEHTDGLEGIAERLRAERPTASGFELDRIKTTAMSRAQAAKGHFGRRRLLAAGLTVGLMAAGTGGVLAASGGNFSTPGNAAVAQYSTNQCDVGNNGNNNNGTNGGNNNNENNNYNCNNDSFNNNGNTTNTINNVTNNTINESTVTISGPAPSISWGGVAGYSATARKSHRIIKVRLGRHHGKVRKVTVTLNGKSYLVLSGKQAASSGINLVGLPCGTSSTTVINVTAKLSNGKTITEHHVYHLCV
ncbi:MAG TPA: hypothetical protein VGX16_05440 [Solirubrobacteraceae bacterium]|nr:hypothetical protein [Solirubrobacteraceae bacterium]